MRLLLNPFLVNICLLLYLLLLLLCRLLFLLLLRFLLFFPALGLSSST